ncbi:MAG: hypothetical protein JSV88_24725 [Candidatus Aminicenantes bacterium]|nr:MAG: hypothetical protein JSV88_24725 [Candidatus Aminicenantes bacterium]
MKIKALHFVFGPCMKGYDVASQKVIAQMGQKTIGLSEELLSHPDIMEKLEALAFGDALEPNNPFEKVYFSALPGNRWVMGRGIRGMDSAGRGAYFFHHLVIEESDLIKIDANPFAVLKKFQFFEKETDLPGNRLIPPGEIRVSEDDCRFPMVDSSYKPHMVNLLADIFSTAPGQPVWVVLKRGEERSFIEQLLGLIPVNERKRMGFSTDFYNSYNIQHYFRLVTVNTEREIPYKNCIIYNFTDGVFPKQPAKKSVYLETLSSLSPKEVPLLVRDLSHLQVNYENIDELSRSREILRTYIGKGAPYASVFHEVVPLETGTVLLGVRHPQGKPDYQTFCDFYGYLIDGIPLQWFKDFYKPSPAPLELFIALFKLVESRDNITLKKKVFAAVYHHLETVGSAALLNQLYQQFPDLSQDMVDYFQQETQWLFFLARLPDLDNLLRSRITGLIYRNMVAGDREKYIHQLPPVISSLDDFGIDTGPLKIIVELHRVEADKEFPDEGLRRYTIDESQYRELMRIGMNIVNDRKKYWTKMCDYLYTPDHNRVFVHAWLDFIRGKGVKIKPMKLITYMEKHNQVDLDSRQEIFDFLGQGFVRYSKIKKYRKLLKKMKKDLPGYKSFWEMIEENAKRGLLGRMVKGIKKKIRKKKFRKEGEGSPLD